MLLVFALMKEIYFATSNLHKFEEAKKILTNFDIRVHHYNFKHNEIRSDSLEEVAKEAALCAYQELQKPVFVEDTGLFIDSLQGFPGCYSAWVLKKIGQNGILKLLKIEKNRAATFNTCIAFYEDKNNLKIFFGTCKGSISKAKKGENGFGYDQIFIPESYKKTFAQSILLKNKLSHRYNALVQFTNHLFYRSKVEEQKF